MVLFYERLMESERGKAKPAVGKNKEKGDDAGTAVLTGRQVEKLRTLVGLSQVELGQRLAGITKQAVSKLERSPKIIVENLEKVASALGFPPEVVQHFTKKKLCSS